MSVRTLLGLTLAGWSILLLPAPPATAVDPQLHVLSVRSTEDHRVSLTFELRPPPLTALPRDAVTVSSGGRTSAASVDRVLSDRAAVALVIDASAAAAKSLGAGGTSGAASFLLQLPPGLSSAVIADRRPPTVAAPRSVGVADDVRAISTLQTGGGRATSQALTLALRQSTASPDASPGASSGASSGALPQVSSGASSGARSVIVLYTSAPDAGGESAAQLSDRLRRADAVLAVVDTGSRSAPRAYWRRVVTATGGLAVAAEPDQAIASFDALADGLRSRYTATFPRQVVPSGRMNLRVDTGRRVLTEAVTVPPEPAGPATTGAGESGRIWLWFLAAGLVLLAPAVLIEIRKRATRTDLARILPARTLPARTLPARALPARALPARALPARGLLARTLPERSGLAGPPAPAGSPALVPPLVPPRPSNVVPQLVSIGQPVSPGPSVPAPPAPAEPPSSAVPAEPANSAAPAESPSSAEPAESPNPAVPAESPNSAEPAEANGLTLPGVRVFDMADPAGPREITSPISALRNRKAAPDDAPES
jgi:hypothetical protein